MFLHREVIKMMGKGGFLGSKCVTPYRVRAFRFTPLDDKMEEVLTPLGRHRQASGAGDASDQSQDEKSARTDESAPHANGAVPGGGDAIRGQVGAPATPLIAVDATPLTDGDAPTPPSTATPPPDAMTASSSFTADHYGKSSWKSCGMTTPPGSYTWLR
jgi:hypothetical protein